MQHLLTTAISMWRRLPAVPEGATCHAAVRAFATVLPGTIVRDGYFIAAGHTHSWLMHEDHPTWIIDVYPWAQLPGSPVLVSVEPLSPWTGVYIPADIWLMRRLTEDAQLLIGYDEISQALMRMI
jgi:hypothetical protein